MRERQSKQILVAKAARQRSSAGRCISEMRRLGEDNLKLLSWFCCSHCLVLLFRSVWNLPPDASAYILRTSASDAQWLRSGVGYI